MCNFKTISSVDLFAIGFITQLFYCMFFLWLSYSSLYIYSLKHDLDFKLETKKQFKNNKIRIIIMIATGAMSLIMFVLLEVPVELRMNENGNLLHELTLAGIVLVLIPLQLFSVFREILKGNIFSLLADIGLLFSLPMLLVLVKFFPMAMR